MVETAVVAVAGAGDTVQAELASLVVEGYQTEEEEMTSHSK